MLRLVCAIQMREAMFKHPPSVPTETTNLEAALAAAAHPPVWTHTLRSVLAEVAAVTNAACCSRCLAVETANAAAAMVAVAQSPVRTCKRRLSVKHLVSVKAASFAKVRNWSRRPHYNPGNNLCRDQSTMVSTVSIALSSTVSSVATARTMEISWCCYDSRSMLRPSRYATRSYKFTCSWEQRV